MLGIYFVLGAFAGLLSGLIGIGGGIVIVPALAVIFSHYTEIPSPEIMHFAIGTSLSILIVSLTSSMIMHNKRGGVKWEYVYQLIPGLLIGAIIGAIIAYFLPSKFLRIFFGIFLIFVAIQLFSGNEENIIPKKISKKMYWLASGVIGCLSSILGLGGGVLIVPFLLRIGLEMRNAAGTSVACALAVAIVATISYMISGLFNPMHVVDTTGYIYWPAFFGIAAMSVLFAPLGAMLAHKLPAKLLKRIFAVFLLIMAMDMLLIR